MKKKFLVILFLSLLFLCTAVYAESITLLSDNALTSNDLKLYSQKGESINKLITGASYKFTEDSDEELVRTCAENGNNELTAGNINNAAGTYVGNTKWDSGIVSTVVFDLQAVYAVDRVDIWHISTNTQQLGNVEIKYSTNGTDFELAGSYTASVPPVVEGKNQYPIHDKFRFTPVNARYISISTKKASATGSGGHCYQYVLNEMLIFGSKDPVDETPSAGEIKMLTKNGDKAFGMDESESVSINCEIKNQNALMLVAGYDQEGKLCDIKTEQGDIKDRGRSYTLSCEYTPKSECERSSVFVFGGTDELKPLCENKELEKRDLSENLLISSKNPAVSGDVYDTNPSYEWVKAGNYATDKMLVTGLDKLFDGDSATYGMTKAEDAYGNLLIHFDTLMDISSVTVRSMCGKTSYMEGYEVYASSDNETYTKIGSAENKNSTKLNRVMATNLPVDHNVYAKDIKIVMHKQSDAADMKIAEVEVYGKPFSLKKIKATDYDYETEVPFKTADDIINADKGRTVLTDGDRETPVLSEGDYVSVIYDLKNYYQVDNIDIYGFASGAEVLTSPDGVTYKNVGYYEFDGDKASTHGVSGRNARYVKIVLHKGDLTDIVLSEIEIYARELYEEDALAESEQVPIYAELKPNNMLYIDWTDFNDKGIDMTGYNVYVEKEKFTKVNISTQKREVFEKGNGNATISIEGKNCVYMGLEPDCDYYVAVAPTLLSVTEQAVNPVKIHTYSALGSEMAASVFCTNDYPVGGGAHVEHDNEGANLKTKLKLLNDMEGMQKTRWWYTSLLNSYPGYAAIGLSFFPECGASASSFKSMWKQNVYSKASTNEPDIASGYKTNYQAFIDRVKGEKEARDASGTGVLLCEPSLCGTDKLAWFEQLYKKDKNFGDYFDVVDIHFYCKNFEGVNHYDDDYTDFESSSVPEHLYGKTKKVRDMLTKYEGNADKPLISSEIGWSTHNDSSQQHITEKVSKERQGDYVARGYLNCIATGIVNAYIYAFQDEYIKNTNSEWQYGVVDWNCDPKPAYYSSYTLMKVIRDAIYLGPVSGIEHPNYGCSFWDETKNQYITALWTADGKERDVNISTTDNVKVISRDGTVYTAEGGTVRIDRSPRYILSNERISVK